MGKSGRTLLVALLALLVSPDVLGFSLNPVGAHRGNAGPRGHTARPKPASHPLQMRAGDARYERWVGRAVVIGFLSPLLYSSGKKSPMMVFMFGFLFVYVCAVDKGSHSPPRPSNMWYSVGVACLRLPRSYTAQRSAAVGFVFPLFLCLLISLFLHLPLTAVCHTAAWFRCGFWRCEGGGDEVVTTITLLLQSVLYLALL